MNYDQHQPLGRLIYKTAQALKYHFERELAPFELTGEQYLLLSTLSTTRGQSQSSLCSLLDKSPANLTRILDRLEKKGLISRRLNPRDRRSLLVFQTASGQTLAARLTALASGFSKQIETGISQQERQLMVTVLARIEANLNLVSKPKESRT